MSDLGKKISEIILFLSRESGIFYALKANVPGPAQEKALK